MDASAEARTFVDSSVLVYAFDTRDRAKQDRAAQLLAEAGATTVISTQVLGEFYWTVTRKLPTPLSSREAQTAIAALSGLSVVPIERELVLSAIRLGELASLAYWDALIIRAAASAACQRVLTEDLNHAQIIDGVRIENPFLDL